MSFTLLIRSQHICPIHVIALFINRVPSLHSALPSFYRPFSPSPSKSHGPNNLNLIQFAMCNLILRRRRSLCNYILIEFSWLFSKFSFRYNRRRELRRLSNLLFNFSSGSCRDEEWGPRLWWWWWWCMAKSWPPWLWRWLRVPAPALPMSPVIAEDTLTAAATESWMEEWWLCKWSFALFPLDGADAELLLAPFPACCPPLPTRSWRQRPVGSDIVSSPPRSIIAADGKSADSCWFSLSLGKTSGNPWNRIVLTAL